MGKRGGGWGAKEIFLSLVGVFSETTYAHQVDESVCTVNCYYYGHSQNE